MSRSTARISSWFTIIQLLVAESQQWSMFNMWPGFGQSPLEWSNHQNIQNQQIQPRVLNFFPVPVEEECRSEDQRRRGICMNTYECRIQQGKSHGPCALGFGVCCVFTTGCGGEVINNLTYVVSPGFPNLVDQPLNCSVVIRKIESQVSQMRIDFIHFNIGQPNLRTGVCDEDVMEITSDVRTFQLCGWNSGQHMYVDVTDGPVTLNLRLPRNLQSRMWEMSITQLPFEQRAPAGCLQYFTEPRGTVKTLNYLPNGRYLANQDYLICMRQEKGSCSIAYFPCSNDSFRIGPSRFRRQTTMDNSTGTGAADQASLDDEGSGTGPVDDAIVDAAPIRRCVDRILIPCDFEEFITPGNDGAGICDMEHCGTSLCMTSEFDADGNCRVETSATPFNIRVAFGMGDQNNTYPVDMTGMCLNYEQLECAS
ncbi:GSCOCG00006949001-RA-CDS [Cotesia congregata]|nr:GSCOCG00006949001-RA-CDS [Cotesia congregata]